MRVIWWVMFTDAAGEVCKAVLNDLNDVEAWVRANRALAVVRVIGG